MPTDQTRAIQRHRLVTLCVAASLGLTTVALVERGDDSTVVSTAGLAGGGGGDAVALGDATPTTTAIGSLGAVAPIEPVHTPVIGTPIGSPSTTSSAAGGAAAAGALVGSGLATTAPVTAGTGVPSGSAAPSTAVGPAASSGPITVAGPATTVAPTSVPVTTAPSAPATTTVVPAPPANGAPIDRVFLLGDSVMAALAPEYTNFAHRILDPLGWDVVLDAKVSRFPKAGIEVLQARRAEIGNNVVIHMGNNYNGDDVKFAQELDEMIAALEGVPRIIVLTLSEFTPSRVEANAVIQALPSRHANVTVLDWGAVTATFPGLTGSDGLHLRNDGAQAMAQLIADTLGPAPG